MRIRRFLAAVLTVLLVTAFAFPVCAEDANPYNVLFGAEIQYVGLDDPHHRGEVYQDITHLVDNEWAMGPRSEQGNYAAKIYRADRDRFNIDGRMVKDGEYAAIITFTLPEAATIAGFRLIHPDVTGAPGAEDPMDFLLTHFDVLGSDGGEKGSWKVLYEARDLRNGSDTDYLYEGVGFGSNGIPFYSYEAKFAEEMKVTHVALAIHALNVENNVFGKHMNIHEFQAFTPAYYTSQENNATEEIPADTAESLPVKEPLRVEDILPKSPVAITAVAAVLATVCAVVCVLHDRKKEKKY